MYTRSNIFPLRFALQALLFCLSLLHGLHRPARKRWRGSVLDHFAEGWGNVVMDVTSDGCRTRLCEHGKGKTK